MRGEGRALFVLRDFHPFLKEPAVVRRLRDAATELRKTKKSLLVLSPVTKIPPELEKSISAVLDWELPNRQEIEQARAQGAAEPAGGDAAGDRERSDVHGARRRRRRSA